MVSFVEGFSVRANADNTSIWDHRIAPLRAAGFTGSMVTAGYRPGDTNDIVTRHH